ncbi:MAG: hypothetical protein LLG24_08845 [Actinomycetia bacterium]|nr:hypothetical protein [Actinomycetes bacterium]
MSTAEYLGRIGEELGQLIRNPASNLVAASLALAIFVITLLLIVVIALIALTRMREEPERAEADATRRSHRHHKRLAALSRRQTAAVWVGVIVIALAGAYISSSSDTFCSSTCHSMLTAADSHEKSTHASVRCVACHQTSAVDAVCDRLRYAYVQLRGTETLQVEVLVEDATCLECHQTILDDDPTVRYGIRVVHAHFFDAGVGCARCHPASGHSETRAVRVGSMSECLKCHSGDKAPTTCDTCHSGDVGAAAVADRSFGKVRLAQPTCGGCHQQKTCDACHGLRMPHPDGYANPRLHARAGAFSGRERLCYRCHAPQDCGQCHGTLTTSGGHTPGWATEHATHAFAEGNGYCLACHKTKDFCRVCHPK